MDRKDNLVESVLSHASVAFEAVGPALHEIVGAKDPRGFVPVHVYVKLRAFVEDDAPRKAQARLDKHGRVKGNLEGRRREPTGQKTHRTSRVYVRETCDALHMTHLKCFKTGEFK